MPDREDDVNDRDVYMVDAATSMRRVIAARRITKHPILVTENRRLTGIDGEKQLYDGLLRQHSQFWPPVLLFNGHCILDS